MKNLKEFIEEFRIGADSWGDVLDAWFESVGQMCVRGLPIPKEYQYKFAHLPVNASLEQRVLNEDSHWHIYFKEADDNVLIDIAKFCTRYAKILKKNGKSY